MTALIKRYVYPADRPRHLVFRGNVCWYADKAHRLRSNGRPSFTAVIDRVATSPASVLATFLHPSPKHVGKWVMHVRLSESTVVAVVFQKMGNGRLLLRTVYPDRRLQKLYGGKKN